MIRRIAIFFILIGFISGIYVFQERVSIESINNRVGLILDVDEYELFSYEHGYNLLNLFLLLRKAGANSISLSEETLEKLKLKGKLSYMSGSDFAYTRFSDGISISPESGSTYIISKNTHLLSMIEKEFDIKIGKDKVKRIKEDVLMVRLLPDRLSEFPLYYPEDLLRQLRDMGFAITLRVTNFSGITEKTIDIIFKRISKIKPDNIIFAGEEVLGYPDYELIKKVQNYIKKEKIPYGIIEFTHQRGIELLSKTIPELAIRVHSISKDELEDMPYKKAVDRWIRAVKERNMRLLFIKPILLGSDVLKTNTEYINDITQGIRKIGYQIAVPTPLSFVRIDIYALIFLSFIVFVAFYYLLKFLILIPGEESLKNLIYILSGIWALMFFGLLLKNVNLAAKFSALTSACTFPALSIIINERYFKDRYRESLSKAILSAITGLLEISFISFIGALLVSLLLFSTPFMLSIEIFAGVKIAYLLPVLLVMAYLWKKKSGGKYPIISTLRKHIKVGDLVILGILGIVGVLFILRSGNFSVVNIPGFEERIRNFLEHTLIARPRTKEFFIGHPILMLTMFWGYLRLRTYKIAFIGLGTIGQTTLVNSFCHIHTPLKIALLRTFNGLWLGILIGLLYIGLFYIGYLIYKKYKKIIY